MQLYFAMYSSQLWGEKNAYRSMLVETPNLPSLEMHAKMYANSVADSFNKLTKVSQRDQSNLREGKKISEIKRETIHSSMFITAKINLTESGSENIWMTLCN